MKTALHPASAASFNLLETFQRSLLLWEKPLSAIAGLAVCLGIRKNSLVFWPFQRQYTSEPSD